MSHALETAPSLYKVARPFPNYEYSLSPLTRFKEQHPDTFKMYKEEAYKMGFVHAPIGAMVRSSYHADQQAHGAGVGENHR